MLDVIGQWLEWMFVVCLVEYLWQQFGYVLEFVFWFFGVVVIVIWVVWFVLDVLGEDVIVFCEVVDDVFYVCFELWVLVWIVYCNVG